MASPIPSEIEGLPTTGAMGTQPTLTVGTIMTAVAIVVGILGQLGIFTPSPDMIAFAEQYGKLAAGVVVGAYTLIQAIILWFRVFAPASVANRYVTRYTG